MRQAPRGPIFEVSPADKKDKTHYERITIGGVNYNRLIYGQDAMQKMEATKTEGSFVRVLSDRFLTHKQARQIYRVG